MQGLMQLLQSLGIDPRQMMGQANYLQSVPQQDPQGVVNWLQQLGIDPNQGYGVRP
jgi:hypothetical protein